MTPSLLFAYIVAVAGGLFVAGCMALLFLLLVGSLTGKSPPEPPRIVRE